MAASRILSRVSNIWLVLTIAAVSMLLWVQEGPGASETLAVKKQWKRGQLKHERLRFKMDLNYDKINNLPKNVPY